ncbi:excalibur calcium-binding domain-containing protein [Arthrobacter sp. MDT3-44]
MAEPVDQVCDEGTSGKQDVTGAGPELTVIAPQGQLIASYCVKAGSSNQGDGPETVVLPTPQSQVTISHSSGKDISHYSYVLVPAPVVVVPIPEVPEVPEVPETPIPEVPEVPAIPTPETPAVPTPETPESPSPELPPEETPVEEVPAEETPAEETPVEEVPAEETPAEETPTEQAPVEETPVVVVPVEEEVPVIVEVPTTSVVVVDTPDNVVPVLDHAAVGVYYENCTEVRDVLGRSILLGEEGFRAGLDRDGDGIGCELDTEGNRTDEGAGNNAGNVGVLVTNDDREATDSTGQLAYTGTDDSMKIAGSIGAGFLALGAGLIRAGRGRHRAVKAQQ